MVKNMKLKTMISNKLTKPKHYTGFAFDEDTPFEKRLLYARQREERGFDDTELWNLDTTIVEFVLPRLIAFKEDLEKNFAGYPSLLCRDYPDIPEDKLDDKWLEILDKMIAAFKAVHDEDEYIDRQFAEKDMEKRWEMDKERDKIISEGLQLFGRYLLCLWT